MIPKIIHYCWFGGNPKPKSVRKCINSWKKYCPDYEIKEWNESNYDINKNQYMKDAYTEKKWGFVPDYARLDIIYHYGGIYLDTDVQVIKCFDDLLDNEAFFGFEDDFNSYYIALGLGFGAKKGNSLIKELLASYSSLSFYTEDRSLNLVASPNLNSPIFIKYGFIMNNELQCINGDTIYPAEFFDPKSLRTGISIITPNTHSIHQYDASWFDEDEQKKKLLRWENEKRLYRIDRLKHAPNIVMMKILGEKRYEKLKQRVKK